jgi:hypothetical protein
MRSLSLLLLLLLSLGLFSQPGDPSFISRLMLEPTIHARWEPSIGHAHTRSSTPSAPLYHLTDTIVVRITGDVKLDGNCSSSTPLYGFQRREGDDWVDYLPPCNVQLCCGMPHRWFRETVALIPAHVARPAYGRPWKPGEYRAVVLLVGDRELVGPAFRVVAGE